MEDRLREVLLVQCRADRIEPPGRIDRIIASARARAEKAFCARTIERLGEVCVSRLPALVVEGNEAGAVLLADLKQDPGAVGPELLLAEITKLNSVRRPPSRPRRRRPGTSGAGSLLVGRSESHLQLGPDLGPG
ncbi:hypothetical protein [Kitasatospora griseola]|uniref:hypothetical protein n=1 Tax=Kitasatospora griseola TaxID=2064 RepID=UPI00364EE426